MNIKLKDYSLISNEWIDERMKELEPFKDKDSALMSAYISYSNIKQQLIPSEMLAEKCYDAGKLDEELSHSFDNPKSRFLNSEIEINN